MYLLAVVFRIVLYSVIAALIAVNFHFYMIKRSDDSRVKQGPAAVQTETREALPPPPSDQLPAVEIPGRSVGATAQTGPDYSALARKANESYLKKDYKNSAEICRQLAEKEKKAFRCVGQSLYMLGDYSNAIINLEKALEAGADEYACRRYLAFSYYFRHDFDKGLMNAEKALAINKDVELIAFHERLLREKNAHLNFDSESTNHFKLQFDGYEHGGISRTVIGILEDAYSQVGRELNYYPSYPITVILYTNQDFYDVTRMQRSVAGFFNKQDLKIRVPVRGADKQLSMLRMVLTHEYVHALIHSIAQNVPLWIHEGMAEYFSKGPAGNALQEYRDALQKRVAMPNPSTHPYWGYHVAISALIEKYSMYRLRELLDAMGQGKEYKQAFQDTYKISAEDFANSLKR